MYKILKNEAISSNSYLLEIECPLAIKNAMPGQFVIVMGKSDSERIPLTIYDCNKEKGILSLIYQVVGASTIELTTLKDKVFAVAGPLGNPNIICKNPEEYKDKRIVYVAGGVGIAPVYPQVKYLKSKGFKIDVIYGARTKELLLIRDKIEEVAENVYYATNDGSFGAKGFVTDILKEHKIYNIKTIVSMNPIMVDGTGMCGACRCEIDGKPKFACIDGPEFDGHKVNFDLALKRMNIYKDEEKKLMEKMIQILEIETLKKLS